MKRVAHLPVSEPPAVEYAAFVLLLVIPKGSSIFKSRLVVEAELEAESPRGMLRDPESSRVVKSRL
jgi:hypothetical protein